MLTELQKEHQMAVLAAKESRSGRDEGGRDEGEQRALVGRFNGFTLHLSEQMARRVIRLHLQPVRYYQPLAFRKLSIRTSANK